MLLSVIVPVYNAEEFLPRCLDSLLNQGLSEEEMEIIGVDDGSTDASLAILRKYEQLHACISVYSQENAGPGAARNLGLENARGEIITFCDADDYIISNGLGYILHTFWRNDIDVICHGSTTLDKKKLKNWSEDNKVQGEVISRGDGREIYDQNPKYFVWNTLVRQSFLEQHHLRFPLLRMTEDSCFMLELMMLRPRTLDISSNIYRYTISEGQITRKRDLTQSRKHVEDYFYFLSRLHAYEQINVIAFQKRPFFSRALSAEFKNREYVSFMERCKEIGLSVPPYFVYQFASLLFRKLFIPYILPHLSRG